MPAGRPREINREALLAAFDLYIAETSIPIVAEFAAKHGISRTLLYEIEEISDAIKRCTFKKEAGLERGALAGDVNCTMAIFSLKQLGWKDTQHVTNNTTLSAGSKTKANDILVDLFDETEASPAEAAGPVLPKD